ncbi:unnamed protein product [Mytilus edulis]|uniref:Uncharacterized protein n=1 Tax=Mytilus edulis TaxID=6550 RepID=A0A8S3QRJ8_MYTED|nr:unnamed protein product [Mytilus edulis]
MEPVRHEDAYGKIKKCDDRGAETSDIAWVFLRLLSRQTVDFPIRNHLPTGGKQIIPFWTGYHRKTSMYCRSFSIVSYAPIVDSKPSDMATVYTTMKRCVDMCMKAGQQYSVQTFDQQLYAIAQQIKWSRPLEFQSHIIRLGGFHTVACFIASIGKLWGDGGLSDLLVDSGVYAGCTVEQMLSGKQFNRAVRALTLTYEAMMSLWVSSFDWCRTTNRLINIPETIWDALLRCYDIFAGDMSSWNQDIATLTSLVDMHLRNSSNSSKLTYITPLDN